MRDFEHRDMTTDIRQSETGYVSAGYSERVERYSINGPDMAGKGADTADCVSLFHLLWCDTNVAGDGSTCIKRTLQMRSWLYNSLLAGRGINHKYIVVDWRRK